MSEMNRREALTLIALAPLASAVKPQPAKATTAPALKFFTPEEFVMVSVLADLVIPRDERSGSATDAKAPEFMDLILYDTVGEADQVAMRGGLAWLNNESRRRYGKHFVKLAQGEQTAILDDIAWPAKARPEMSHGVAFFSRFRDMVASAFWSSQMGVKDLQYMGNTVVIEWDGCPPEALKKLGVRYD